ncbi:MAG: hypothetical protein U0228_08205 [Myxococcaceae bacterium]
MDLRRLKEQASRLSAEGRYERAEVLYRQLLTHAPRDSSLWLKHAETLKRLDRSAPAVSSYRMAASLLADSGHGNRAVACLKIALGLQPDDVDLVSDIIRVELRERQRTRGRELVEEAIPPAVSDPSVMSDEKHAAPLLALPMFVSSDSRLADASGPPQPPPRASVPRIPVEVEAPLLTWPQIRRLADGAIAIKPSPFSHWVVLTSRTGIEVTFFDEYPVPDDALWLEEPSS